MITNGFEESLGNAVREDELVSEKESKKRKLMNSNFVLVLPSLFLLVPRFYRKTLTVVDVELLFILLLPLLLLLLFFLIHFYIFYYSVYVLARALVLFSASFFSSISLLYLLSFLFYLVMLLVLVLSS